MNEPAPHRPTSGPIVYLAGSSFEAVHGTDAQLVDTLARSTEMIWVDPPQRWSPGSALGVVAGRLPDAPGIRRVSISVVPGGSRPVLRTMATRSYVRSLVRLLKDRGVDGGTVVAASWQPVLPLVPERFRRVLYATDDFVAAAGLWGMDPAYLARARAANLRSADAVVTVSPALADLHASPGRLPVVIPNGCDPSIFARNAAPVGGIRLPHPVAGVVGQMNERTDLAHLRAVLAAGMSLLVVGPRCFADTAHDREFGDLVRHPRARWVDAVPRAELGGYLAHMDVGLCAYADTAFNRSSSPLKTLDYLAAGVPAVVTSPARITTHTPGAVHAEDAPESFARAALAAAQDPPRADDLRAEARRHSWSERAPLFLEAFLG